MAAPTLTLPQRGREIDSRPHPDPPPEGEGNKGSEIGEIEAGNRAIEESHPLLHTVALARKGRGFRNVALEGNACPTCGQGGTRGRHPQAT
jgi:hypothetical protein